ncbi:MAG: glycosyltransferase family 1 protein [Oscillospiraceae bacterium]|nr:glycosyltransferase family 1 protein [Oscillospiraceae bacterium]MCI9394826.1 glycosyltransferase family 1 protein [Oscillospiraceae bacterium]
MKQIICLAQDEWSTTPSRTQQLVGRLKDVQVLYFVPARSMLDQSYRKRGRRVRPNVTVYTLPPVLEVPEDMRPLFALEQRRLAGYIAKAAASHRFRSPLLWTTCPDQVHLLDKLNYDALVYDCFQDWSFLPPDWEGTLAQLADVVFAASPALADRLSPCSGNIAVLPYGHTYALFAQCPPPPATSPVLGYAGTLWPDLDLWPVFYTAQRHPDWRFLLLGRREPTKIMAKLKHLPNVGMTGRLPAREVPRYLSQCHVLLDLRRKEQAEDILSPRLYEYLTTGRPIVSMLEEDQVEAYPDVIYAAHSLEEFERMCVRAIQEPPGWASQRRREHGENAAWSQRSAQVSRILNTAGLLSKK